MIPASDVWKEKQQGFLAPEGFVEIDCAVTEDGLQQTATASGTDEAEFSQVENILGLSDTSTIAKYATLEHNLWRLDGSRNILPDEEPYPNVGYVSDIAETGSVTLSLPEVHTAAIPGVTIIWSSEFEEYPPVFTVTAYNGTTVVAETTITDNTEQKCLVDIQLVDYDRVTVTVHNWSLPNHRARIEKVYLGHLLTFTKSDIISYTHEQIGSVVSGELPKNYIEFSIDNSDNRWNPYNPTGLEQYLSERQRLTVRYGFDIDGTTEWIKAGTFYLSEWRAPANGVEATFVARDVFEYMLNIPFEGTRTGSMLQIAESAIAQAGLPSDVLVDIFSFMDLEDGNLGEGEYTIAEVLQLCANASSYLMYQNYEGSLIIWPADFSWDDYLIPEWLSYSYPEIELTKRLKRVEVSYGEDKTYSLDVASSGETETIHNPILVNESQVQLLAEYVQSVLERRQVISGEFRADPRLELFDVVTVESKFGSFSPVVITNIKYTFNGTFRGSYTGRVVG